MPTPPAHDPSPIANSVALFLALAALLGCGRSDVDAQDEGGALATDTAFSRSPCRSNGLYTSAVDMEDTTLGYSARMVSESFAKNGPGTLTWFDGTLTLLLITADVSQATVTIDNPPPYQGYCPRTMKLENVSFTITTEDGRLNESRTRDLLFAVDAGGPVLSVFPGDLLGPLTEVRGSLQLPANWRAGLEHEGIGLVVNSRANLESPYCRPGEKADVSPTSRCTASSGKIIYNGHQSTVDGIDGLREQLVGQWTWQ